MPIPQWNRTTRDLLALSVLGLLAEKPSHPYEMQRILHERYRNVGEGQQRGFYHAVGRLAASNLIEVVETNREGRRPERTVYQLSEAGREELRHWLVDLLARPLPESPQFTAALSMIAYLTEGDALRALGLRVAALEGMIAGSAAVLTNLQAELGLPRLFLIEREYERALWRAELAWVSGLMHELRSGALAVDQQWLRSNAARSDQSRHPDRLPLATAPPKPRPATRPGRGSAGGGPDLTLQSGGAA